MSKSTKLQELKMKIAEYNPDIMELKFGRNVKFEYNDKMEEGIFGNICETSNGIIWLKERYLENGYEEGDNMVQYKFIDCKGKFNGTGWLRCEIIGRDITLFDIIVFMSKIGYKVGELTKIIEMWKSPNCLDNQDDDTINIISKLCMQKVKNKEGIDTE
jgi:hypothetical protein